MTILQKLYRVAWHNKSKARDYVGRCTASLETAKVCLDLAQTEYANSGCTFWIEESDDGGVTWQKCN